jgi:hypothetical protein
MIHPLADRNTREFSFETRVTLFKDGGPDRLEIIRRLRPAAAPRLLYPRKLPTRCHERRGENEPRCDALCVLAGYLLPQTFFARVALAGAERSKFLRFSFFIFATSLEPFGNRVVA